MKQVILVRADLKMPKGKLAVQVAHASVEATLKCDKGIIAEWRDQGMKKVVLKVKDKKELLDYNQFAKDAGLKTALITDAGKTFFDTHATTCTAIGPAADEKIDKVTGQLTMV